MLSPKLFGRYSISSSSSINVVDGNKNCGNTINEKANDFTKDNNKKILTDCKCKDPWRSKCQRLFDLKTTLTLNYNCLLHYWYRLSLKVRSVNKYGCQIDLMNSSVIKCPERHPSQYITMWDITSIISSIKAVIKYNTLINDKHLDFLWTGYIWYVFLIKTLLCFSFHLCHITHHMHDFNEAWSNLLFYFFIH